MTQMCGDESMLQSYRDGKDLYTQIAAISFNTSYEECLEHFPEGSYIKQVGNKWFYATEDDYDKLADGENDVYDDGKERRGQAKSIFLGLLYGRGIKSISEQLHTSKEKAQEIQDSLFKGFPAIKQFEQDSLQMAEEKGYVTTLWGRKRRLPDIQLPEYEFEWVNGASKDADPLDFDEEFDDSVPDEIIEKYLRLLNRISFKDKYKVFKKAEEKDGIKIIDNGAKIADATRQVVNSRIQGSAADMTKLAMISIGSDERLKELGFRLLIPVHDELIGECPEENMVECRERFSQLMSETPGNLLTIPINCDVVTEHNWYGGN